MPDINSALSIFLTRPTVKNVYFEKWSRATVIEPCLFLDVMSILALSFTNPFRKNTKKSFTSRVNRNVLKLCEYVNDI